MVPLGLQNLSLMFFVLCP